MEAVAPRRVRNRPETSCTRSMPWRANGSIARCSAPGRWSVTNENAVRQSSAERSRRVPVRDRDKARVRGLVVADVAVDHLQPVQGRSALTAIAVTEGSPPSATSAAASAVVPAAIAVATASPPAAACTGRARSMRAHDADLLERHVLDPDQAVPDLEHRLVRDRERRRLEQVVGLGDRPGDRALDREHAERDIADGGGLRDRREARQRQELPSGKSCSDAVAAWAPSRPA